MNEELLGYVKKMSVKSMKIYYGLLVCLALLFGIMLLCRAPGIYLLFCGAVSVLYIAIIYAIEHSRRKSARENIDRLFGRLSMDEQHEVMEKLREMPDEQWKAGFAATPEITFFTNGHGVHAIPTSTILWAYEKIDIMVPLFKYYSVYMYTEDGEKHNCEVGMCPIWGGRDQDDIVTNAVWSLQRYYPGIISGYSRDMYRMFTRDIEAVKQMYRDREEQNTMRT
ncbi:hypothetical protein [Clostridium sp. AM58-1XD]|uniref:hypothetical protein n=1 Tax=Clostridium sp. AM58-1XD TaxID=2292307 RepID=UPI000E50E33F|nr:hypothetical protein [Clostridium sp. AM58-1XD]RGY99851.1 hypothetical protein DXA13_06455 [Clostridium sp. AM58-1XD]